MASGKPPRFSRLSESPPDSHGGGGGGITGGRAAGSGSGEVRGDRLNLSMAYGKFFRDSRLSESPPHSHGGGGHGITGGRAAGSGSGEVRGDRLNRSDQIARRDPYPLLPGRHGFGFKKEKSADCHDGCVPKEEHERLLKRLRDLGQEFLAYCRDSPYVCCTPALQAAKVRYTPRSTSDLSKAEQHELLYDSPLSSHWGRKSGGGREPADRFQEDFYSHSGMGKGGGRPYGDGYDDLGSSSQPFRGEAVARNSPKLRQREGDWRCSCGFSNFAWRLHCRECQGPLPEHMSGSSFPYAPASSYAGPSADCRAPPVPPSHAPRARDIWKRSPSPTGGALPPKEYGGDLKMKRGRDDRHEYGGDLKMKRGRDDRHGPV